MIRRDGPSRPSHESDLDALLETEGCDEVRMTLRDATDNLANADLEDVVFGVVGDRVEGAAWTELWTEVVP